MLEIHDNAYLIIINLNEKVSIEIHRPYLFLFFFFRGRGGYEIFFILWKEISIVKIGGKI